MTNKIKIHKGIPIPKIKGRGPFEKYPFAKMKIGDCFALPKTLKSNSGNLVYQAGKRHNAKFTMRKIAKGTVIWRVA